MNLSKNNFTAGTVHKLINGWEVHVFARYSYESHNAIYDVDIDSSTGEVFFKKNSNPLPVERNKFHDAIIKHYNLEN